MKDKITRTKKFVQDHKISIATVTGIAIGAVAAVSIVKASQPHMLNKLYATSEDLQKLIDNPEGVISFDITSHETTWLLNAASKEKF